MILDCLCLYVQYYQILYMVAASDIETVEISQLIFNQI